MAETRAIKRILKGLEASKAKSLTFNSDTRISEIKTYLILLNDDWKEFQGLEKSLKGKFDETNLEMVDKIETIYYEVRQSLVLLEKQREESNINIGSHNMEELVLNQSHFLQEVSSINRRENEVRLPRVNIPTFSGQYSEFPSFRDLFEASIHNNGNISKVHKLQYLKGLLKGEAYAIITHLSVTEANYDEAWDKIKTRYDKPKHVIHTLLKRFIEQPILQSSCPSNIRNLCDISDEVIRGLKVLGEQAEKRDPWLIYIVTSKLDYDSREAWAHETVETDYPTLDQLFRFLNRRSDTLETLNTAYKSKLNHAKRISSLVTQSTISICSLCSGDHYLGRCEEYMKLSTQERKQVAVDKKLCFNCLSSSHQSTACRSRYSCRICRRRHHLTLHPESTTEASQETSAQDSVPNNQKLISNDFETYNAMLSDNVAQFTQQQAILPTASVLVKDKFGKLHKCRALLDSGSQSSFVSEYCAQRLQLERHTANVRITGVTAGSVVSKGKTVIRIGSLYNADAHIEINALIINQLPSRLPRYNIAINDKQIFQKIQLADPEFNKSLPIDILIGADEFFNIIENGQRKFNSIILQKSLFGWIVSGQPQYKGNQNASDCMTFNVQLDLDVDATLRKFWEIEETPEHKHQSPEDVQCEEFFKQSHKRDKDGRYIVRLPFKNTVLKLGNSINTATQRFLALERKLKQNQPIREQYSEQMREYLNMGHMIEIQPTREEIEENKLFYLPHHSVIKETSTTTKVRVVFDGSCKTNTGVSLNDQLMVGPTIQPTLWATLMRFRTNRIAITADIERMYRQVSVALEDLDFQRILWREDPKKQLRHYKLTRVTFGLACSAFLAIRSLHQLAHDDGNKNLQQHVLNDFYVDDLLSGASDVQKAVELKSELINLLQQGGFTLRKWQSNVASLRDEVNNKTTIDLCSDDISSTIILGMHWHTFTDVLTFKVNQERHGQVTKRKIISESSRVFDPLGFLSPSIVLLKILFQKLWFLKIDWDDKLPDYFESEYRRIRNEFKYFGQVKMPRFSDHYKNVQLLGFADASKDAYCAVIYSRVTDTNGAISINLLTSKTKVAPIKQISLPRLELCAALLLSKLMDKVKETIAPSVKCYTWTDSMIVLAWLSTYPARWKTFVANRTSQILDKFPRHHWGHVKSTDNPADHGSKGIYPQQLVELKQWWQGPEWLHQPEAVWPTTQPNSDSNSTTVELESTKIKFSAYQTYIENDWISDIFERRSRLQKVLRIIAYVKRFIGNIKQRDIRKRKYGELNSNEIENARITSILWVQASQFGEEINNLQRNKTVTNGSTLLSLAPFLDSNGILRVGGRLFNADCEFDHKHPIIMPSKHIFTEKVIWETHNKNLHAGPTLTTHLIRQMYWIINGRARIRSILKNCVMCARYSCKKSIQLMGNLPAERVTPTRLFTNCGIDFAGPLYFATKKGRGGTNPVKGYLCIFVCLSIKAVHIEPVSDLTSEAFLAALKRFVSRRGVPKKIYTDNGSNFIGAKRILNEAFLLIQNINNNYLISEFLSDNCIDWHFIPPSSPHFGGLWESTVKSVETHLLKSSRNVNLTFEEMATLLCQIENILNSRPLYTTSSDDNYEVLTPSHFLIGTSTGTIPEKSVTAHPDSSLTRWQRVQIRTQLFWKKYYRDYLNSLQQRCKWQKPKEDIKEADVVLIKDDNAPVCKWPLGQVIRIHPGDDGLVRVVTIKTASSTLQRPVVKLCKLPIC